MYLNLMVCLCVLNDHRGTGVVDCVIQFRGPFAHVNIVPDALRVKVSLRSASCGVDDT